MSKITTNYFFLIEEYQKYKKKYYDNELIQNIVDKVKKQSQGKKKNLNFGKISKKKLQKHNMCNNFNKNPKDSVQTFPNGTISSILIRCDGKKQFLQYCD
jgi:hypothetical protein